MKKVERLSVLQIIIIILALAGVLEVCLILRNIIIIKAENSTLRNENYKLKNVNKDLHSINNVLKGIILQFHEPDTLPPDIPGGFKIYRYLEFGFEVGYPGNYHAESTGTEEQHKSNEVMGKLFINSEKPEMSLKINIFTTPDVKNINNYINNKFKYRVYPKKQIYTHGGKCSLYKLSGEKHYYVFFSNKKYIFSIESSNENILEEIAKTFRFI